MKLLNEYVKQVSCHILCEFKFSSERLKKEEREKKFGNVW